MFYVKIPTSKTNIPRTFTISNVNNMEFMRIVRDYMNRRPKNCSTDRFFLKYIDGKCHNQPVGKNTFSKIPADIAIFFKIPDPQLFTGHCFRRSSATLLANSGCDILELKRLGGCHCCRRYADESFSNKLSTSRKLFANHNANQIISPSTSTSMTDHAIPFVESSDENNCGTVSCLDNEATNNVILISQGHISEEQ